MLLNPFLYNKFNPTRVCACFKTGELTCEKVLKCAMAWHFLCLKMYAFLSKIRGFADILRMGVIEMKLGGVSNMAQSYYSSL